MITALGGWLAVLIGIGTTVWADWPNETVDTGIDVGQFTSVAIGIDGDVHISYYNVASASLKYARTGHQPGVPWKLEVVDFNGVGQYTSLALDSSGRPHISFFDEANHKLKYAYKPCAYAWLVEPVDNADVGSYTSIAVDSLGIPNVSYRDESTGNLKHATKFGDTWILATVDSASGEVSFTSIALDSQGNPHVSYVHVVSCGAFCSKWSVKYASKSNGTWTVEVVDSLYGLGRVSISGTSLALDAQDSPHISYGKSSRLLYAQKPSGAWIIETVDSTTNIGAFTSLALDPDDLPAISYHDYTHGDLKYASKTGGVWNTAIVDSVGPTVGEYSSLAFDRRGSPGISYYNGASGNLKFANLFLPPDTTVAFVCTSVSGTVVDVSDNGGLLGGGVQMGQPFTAYYMYTTSTPDSNAAIGYGDYLYSTPPFGISISTGNLLFRTDPTNVHFTVEVATGVGQVDTYHVSSTSNDRRPLPNDLIVDAISWHLTGPVFTLGDDRLPRTAPTADAWFCADTLTITGSDVTGSSTFLIKNEMTEVMPCKTLESGGDVLTVSSDQELFATVDSVDDDDHLLRGSVAEQSVMPVVLNYSDTATDEDGGDLQYGLYQWSTRPPNYIQFCGPRISFETYPIDSDPFSADPSLQIEVWNDEQNGDNIGDRIRITSLHTTLIGNESVMVDSLYWELEGPSDVIENDYLPGFPGASISIGNSCIGCWPTNTFRIVGSRGSSSFLIRGHVESRDPTDAAGPGVGPDKPLIWVYPNPFRRMTKIQYQAGRSTATRLEIYDVAGHRVRVFYNAPESRAVRDVVWDGRDSLGRRLASGLYFYRVRGAGINLTGKLVLLQ